MALRSLVVKLKALPLRMPGYGAFVPKDIPIPRSSSAEVMALHKQLTKSLREHEKLMRAYDRNTFLIGAVSFGSLGYAFTHI